jgi:hypothetical protein
MEPVLLTMQKNAERRGGEYESLETGLPRVSRSYRGRGECRNNLEASHCVGVASADFGFPAEP